MITEIEPSKGSDIFINFGTSTWYKAQRVEGKKSFCDILKIIEASDNSTAFEEWGVNRDGTINLYEPSIRRFQR